MNILVFAPHNDDEILGVGGTVAKFIREGHRVTICEITVSVNQELQARIASEAKAAREVLGVQQFESLALPVVELRNVPTKELNKRFVQVVEKIKPEIAFIPHKGDMHVDHQETHKAAMVALRPYTNPQLKTIYAYETLSETEWNTPTVDNAFQPDTWNDITETIEIKKQAMRCYRTQLKEFPNPRSLEAIEALAKLRGSTVGYRYAECFMTVRNLMG